ncbi:Aspartyl protease [Luteibacter sp. UNCMF366Tsu5.1]|nr:Aspartyl protease [Luteibacter sp. UNCMF366Tsu5.1]
MASQTDTVTRTETAFDAWRMDEVSALLPTLPDTAEGDYVRGLVANRMNDVEASKRFLSRALPALERQHSPRAVNALLTLSDDYQKTSSYADQSAVLREAAKHHAKDIGPDAMRGVEDVIALSSALSGSPPQTVSFSGASRLPIRRNPLGTLDVDAVANGIGGSWMLDSGANYSVVSESFAKRLGLSVKGTAGGIGSSTGASVQSKVAIVKEIHLGSATLHNVAVLVVADDQLHIKLPNKEHQITAAFGFPVFQALGRIRFHGDTAISIGPAPIPLDGGVPIYMDGLTPVVLGFTVGERVPLVLDTGASSTSLSSAYWMKVKDGANSWPRSQQPSAGLGGAQRFDVVTQPEWKLILGTDETTLKNVRIETVSRSGPGGPPMFGTVGQDAWANAAGFTVDFQSMRFRIDRN